MVFLACKGVFASENITEFERKYPLRFLIDYNFVSLTNSEFHEGALISNRPVDVGLGFGYKDWYLDLNFSLPFTSGDKQSKSIAYEYSLNFFPKDWWIIAHLRQYSGFSSGSDSNRIFVDLWELDTDLSALWMLTSNGNFSPRAAFFLDRKQKISAGSFIVGGKMQFNLTVDKDSILTYYNDYRKVALLWANGGYTYTWVYNNGMFINAWAVAGLAMGSEIRSKDFLILPEISAKFTFGYITDKWSWNNVLETKYVPTFFNDHTEQKSICAYKILVVRRF